MTAAAPPIRLMALGGFASGAGMRMLDPILPAIAGEFGRVAADAAALIAVFMLGYGLTQVAAGPLGDRFGKLRVASAALILFGVATAAAALAPSLEGLVTLRAVAGVAAGAVIPLLIAHIGDSTPYAERQASLAAFAQGMVFAQLLAGPISGVVAEGLGWRASFVGLGLFGASVGAVLVARLWAAGGPTGARGAAGLAGYLAVLRAPAARRLLPLVFLDGLLLFGGAFPFVGSFLVEGFSLSSGAAGLVVAGFGLGALLYTRLARRMLARWGEAGLLRRGALGLAGLLAMMAVAPAWWAVAGLQFLLGFAFYMLHGVLQARGTEMLPEARGTAMGAFALALFLGQAVGAVVFAAVISMGGYGAGFGVAAVGALGLAWWMGGRGTA